MSLERALSIHGLIPEAVPLVQSVTTDRPAGPSAKVRVHRRPPRGATVETTLVQRFFPVALRHHNPPPPLRRRDPRDPRPAVG